MCRCACVVDSGGSVGNGSVIREIHEHIRSLYGKRKVAKWERRTPLGLVRKLHVIGNIFRI